MILVLIGTGIVLLFGVVLLFGAPYLPTLQRQAETALDLLELKTGDTLLELGCGDGKLLRMAAERGVRSIGYELNPILVVVSKVRTRKYRHLVEVHLGNYWHATWPKADAVYVFLLDAYMPKLHKALLAYASDAPVRVASFAFKIPNKPLVTEKDGIFLYNYDAKKDTQ